MNRFSDELSRIIRSFSSAMSVRSVSFSFSFSFFSVNINFVSVSFVLVFRTFNEAVIKFPRTSHKQVKSFIAENE